MANQLGSSGLVTIGGSTVAEVLDFSWDEGVAIIDDSILGDAADTHQAGSTNAKGTISCFWDETDTNGQEAMTIGASVAVVFKPEGASGGDTIYTATATVESVGVAVTRNAIITRSFGLVVSGAIVASTV